jgi:hypothetical protein
MEKRAMLQLVPNDRTYSPETLDLMTAAFRTVSQSISGRMNGNEGERQTLALMILRHVDLGERDPERLADIALRELTGGDRSAGQTSATP